MTYSVFQTLVAFPAALRESIASAAAWCVTEMCDVDEFVGEGAKTVRRHFENLLSWDESCVESGWAGLGFGMIVGSFYSAPRCDFRPEMCGAEKAIHQPQPYILLHAL